MNETKMRGEKTKRRNAEKKGEWGAGLLKKHRNGEKERERRGT